MRVLAAPDVLQGIQLFQTTRWHLAGCLQPPRLSSQTWMPLLHYQLQQYLPFINSCSSGCRVMNDILADKTGVHACTCKELHANEWAITCSGAQKFAAVCHAVTARTTAGCCRYVQSTANHQRNAASTMQIVPRILSRLATRGVLCYHKPAMIRPELPNRDLQGRKASPVHART
jgi:hypothetical protein